MPYALAGMVALGWLVEGGWRPYVAAAWQSLVHSPASLPLAGVLAASAIVYGLAAVLWDEHRRRRWSMIYRLREMDGLAFERHVAETYRRLGYRAELTKASGDQGADVIASRGGERIVVQCKRYTGTVGNAAVQQAHAARAYYSCAGAAVICASSFTLAAKELAVSTGVDLVDGERYADLVRSIEERDGRRLQVRWMPRGRALALEIALLILAVGLALAHVAG